MPGMLGIIFLSLPVCEISLTENIFHLVHFCDKTDLLFEPFFSKFHVFLHCIHLHFLLIIPCAQKRKRRAAGFTFQSMAPWYNPCAAGRSGETASDCTNVQSLYHVRRKGSAAQRSGEAASDCTNIQSLYHVRRKGSAAPAAFTFQAGGPGIIPAQRGEAVRPLRIVRMYNHYTTMRKKENPLCPGNFSQKDFPVQRGLCVLLIWSELTALSFRSYCRSLHSMQRTPPVSDKAVRL